MKKGIYKKKGLEGKTLGKMTDSERGSVGRNVLRLALSTFRGSKERCGWCIMTDETDIQVKESRR